MLTASWATGLTWAISVAATVGVVLRPWGWPEAVWAVAGAALLVFGSLLPARDALAAIGQGTDVYLFLAGMMLLAELARNEGLFDWLAALAARWAGGSARRLFLLVYGVGIVVTALLSNDATAVVLTPAVYAAARAARAEPLPYLYACAFVANAASFVLPISNPANLVVFASRLPPLPLWLERFTLPSLLSILATYAALRWAQRHALRRPIAERVEVPPLGRGGRLAAVGILAATATLIVASAAGAKLGLPTFLAGLITAALVLAGARQPPWTLLAGVSWGVLPLVAGLFVLVAALDRTGVLAMLAGLLRAHAATAPYLTLLISGLLAAAACNLMNNLPVGLMSGALAQSGALSPLFAGGLLVAVDLGPNLSVTGSLATILWLVALRREGQSVRGRDFLRLGLLVMPPALLLALAAIAGVATGAR